MTETKAVSGVRGVQVTLEDLARQDALAFIARNAARSQRRRSHKPTKQHERRWTK